MNLRTAMERGLLPGRDLLKLLQRASDFEVDQVEATVLKQGLEALTQIYDDLIRLPADKRPVGDLLFILKFFAAAAGYGPGYDRIVHAARIPLAPDSELWSTVFSWVRDDESKREAVSTQKQLISSLAAPLPPGFIRVAYLDGANRYARAGIITKGEHPFDSLEGQKQIEEWLVSKKSEEVSYAHSATTALPFLSNPDRDRLIALAMEHRDPSVQMEAAFSSASLGNESGLQFLAQLCLNPKHSSTAARFLKELGHEILVPDQALEPDFQAMAEMCAWLAHPREFGRPPDHIELFDTRTMHWPPTSDERPLWLFAYSYKGDEDQEESEGIGFVGSITYASIDEVTTDLSPQDIYGLYCCQELEWNNDPRAPDDCNAQAGRRIIEAFNGR